MDSPAEILELLDSCCDSFAFPMLDNGYVYLAATRLSLFRSQLDWAMVIEVFGYSPRAGLPDVSVSTFASTLHDRDPVAKYVSPDAHQQYLRNHPHNDFRSFYPLDEGPWLVDELVVESPDVRVVLRDQPQALPPRDAYAEHGIHLESPDHISVFELCRYLAAIARDSVLATSDERRVSVLPEMMHVLQLEEWHHPDLAGDQRPSELESFQQLARVLSTGDAGAYRPSAPPNTHWKHWPESGTL